MVNTLVGVAHPNASSTTLDRQVRAMFAARDGIAEDYDGQAFKGVLSGSQPTVTITSAGRYHLVDGQLVAFATDAVLNASEVGGAGTAGQSRNDLVVVRYDTNVATIANRGLLAIKPGTWSTSPPAAPAPTRTVGGVWEVPIGTYRYTSGGLLSQWVSTRRWAGNFVAFDDATDVDGSYPVGTWGYKGTTLYRRVLGGGGVPVWRQTPEAYADKTERYAGTPYAADFTVNATLRQLVQPITIPAVPYPRTLDAHAGALIIAVAANDPDAYLDYGFRLYQGASLLHDRVRLQRLYGTSQASGFFEQQFDLEADKGYTLQVVGSSTRGIVVEIDRRFTYLTAALRGNGG